MKMPKWLMEEVARQGALVLAGQRSQAEARTEIAAATHAHPGYIADLIAADADKSLSGWLKDNTVPVQSPQLSLFPELPRRMRVAPAKYADVASMDAVQLDHARNMLLARTQNAMDGAKEAAEHERKVFAAFYNRVRPLLTDGLTVSDVLERLAEKAA